MWLLVGLAAAALATPGGMPSPLAARRARRSSVMVSTSLAVYAVAEYSAPVVPAFVLLATAGLFGRRAPHTRCADRRVRRRSAVRDLAVILGAAWIARLLFVLAIGDAHSLDVDYWRGALAALDKGRNPYETGVLNWPPLWLS